MMKNNTLLIVVSQDTPLKELGEKLEVIRAIPARASILILSPTPSMPYYAIGAVPYGTAYVPLEWSEEIARNRDALTAKANDVKKLLQDHGVSGEVAAVACDETAIQDRVARHALLSDMAWISEDLRAHDTLFANTLQGVLFESPIGVLLNASDAAEVSQPKRVFIAWNTQVQASRAVHQALPLLCTADEVIVGMVDPTKDTWSQGEDPGVDIAKWLSHHGCNVVVDQYPSGGQDIGKCILDRAKEAGADLIVMGAYSRSKAREALFGGTTRDMIKQTDQAVFLVH
jgi:nucleotide-binding universal stress UspA family protein